MKEPIGAQSLQAMASLGLEELRAAFFTDSNIARPTEPGMYGDRSHIDVLGDRKEVAEASQLADKLKEIEASRDVRERESQELTRE